MNIMLFCVMGVCFFFLVSNDILISHKIFFFNLETIKCISVSSTTSNSMIQCFSFDKISRKTMENYYTSYSLCIIRVEFNHKCTFRGYFNRNQLKSPAEYMVVLKCYAYFTGKNNV